MCIKKETNCQIRNKRCQIFFFKYLIGHRMSIDNQNNFFVRFKNEHARYGNMEI